MISCGVRYYYLFAYGWLTNRIQIPHKIIYETIESLFAEK